MLITLTYFKKFIFIKMLPPGPVTLAFVVATSASAIRECIDLNGVPYSGLKEISSSGEVCLNWINTTLTYNLTLDLDNKQTWDHSYCRNPDASPRPWCFVLTEKGIERQDCVIDTCREQTIGALSSAEGQTEPQSVHPHGESVAVKPDPGLGRRVSLGTSKKKKDLGALGYALGAILMAVIVLLGAGISIGYVYKKGLKLRMQQEQRTYEQEMHRINLPLSAFTNQTCDLSDEQPTSVQRIEKTEIEGHHEIHTSTEGLLTEALGSVASAQGS
ncbi:phosphoinositide-3-kinase-interacting protein 1-like isoform X2 [Hoplias malabaricus]|uniref:phosphoinositide-3-kinase-interacting protein 1-like isoform X2 n=1 Tax=Hoplias malabaricus TaxID=27720 RepID=UPI003461A2FE